MLWQIDLILVRLEKAMTVFPFLLVPNMYTKMYREIRVLGVITGKIFTLKVLKMLISSVPKLLPQMIRLCQCRSSGYW